jgi:signal transduction histidine kinase
MDPTQGRDELPGMFEAAPLARPEPTGLTDEQMLAAARLVVVGELARDVAHELNNPLFAILGLVELLLSSTEPGSRVEQRLALIQKTGLEMKEIVHNLLDFARGSSNGVEVVTLGEIARRAAEIARRASAAKDVELVVDPGPAGALVECDPAQVAPVLLDLITKATRSLPNGGTVSVTVETDGRSAIAQVTASGTKVEPARLDAGVGLSVDRAALEAVGGSLTQRDGTQFSVRLPLHAERLAA